MAVGSFQFFEKKSRETNKMSLRIAFETRLSPLFGASTTPMSATCSIGIQTREENEPGLDNFYLEFASSSAIGENARPLGWNFIEMESNSQSEYDDHSGLCVWLQCRQEFQIHPPYLCTDGYNYKSSNSDDSLHVLGTFNILPVSFRNREGNDFIPIAPPTGILFLLLVLLRILYLTFNIILSSKDKSQQLEDWTLLGTFPELQPDGQFRIIPCSPVPQTHEPACSITILMDQEWENQSSSSSSYADADDDNDDDVRSTDEYSDADDTQSIETT